MNRLRTAIGDDHTFLVNASSDFNKALAMHARNPARYGVEDAEDSE